MEVLYQEMYKMKVVEARKRVIKTYEETKSIRKTAIGKDDRGFGILGFC